VIEFEKRIQYLGFIILAAGLIADSKKMKVVIKWPISNDCADVKSSTCIQEDL
jgi:hypothetical protein